MSTPEWHSQSMIDATDLAGSRIRIATGPSTARTGEWIGLRIGGEDAADVWLTVWHATQLYCELATVHRSRQSKEVPLLGRVKGHQVPVVLARRKEGTEALVTTLRIGCGATTAALLSDDAVKQLRTQLNGALKELFDRGPTSR
ncbi:hypothetical protein [Amycolatopsis anabasis]|uniref:hypothetical protein n=1 Tax=Amycolatopsis anabasis TaxID=1840409 RepID=UPI00131CBDE0|nr:hypothetical protein [Amycolatopsis anabasis]